MTIRTGDRDVTIAPETTRDAVLADGISGYVTERPHDRPFVPPDNHFTDDDDFLPAPELEQIGRALIARYSEIQFLANASIEYRWKRKGGKSKGKDVYGTCVKTSGLVRHFSECTFVIWIAADHVRESFFDNLQLEALLHHELLHATFEVDDKTGEMKWAIRGHDDEVFLDELRRYGAWNQSRRRAKEAYGQVALPEAS
jgi:hypothetical protein